MLENNVYKSRIGEFPGKLINSPFEEDFENIKNKIEAFESCYLEIGSGSGMHLLSQAQLKKDSLWLGIERRYKRAVRTVEKAEEKTIENILLCRTNAEDFVQDFPSLRFKGIYVLFPDPWPKRRHWKKRIMTAKNIKLFSELLDSDGFLIFKTDSKNYFDWTLEELKKVKGLKVEASSNDYQKEINSGNTDFVSNLPGEGIIKSEFENLFLTKGDPVNYLHLSKKSRLFTF